MCCDLSIYKLPDSFSGSFVLFLLAFVKRIISLLSGSILPTPLADENHIYPSASSLIFKGYIFCNDGIRFHQLMIESPFRSYENNPWYVENHILDLESSEINVTLNLSFLLGKKST